MSEIIPNPEDLEDGEIESNGEDNNEVEVKQADTVLEDKIATNDKSPDHDIKNLTGKKKKSKNNKSKDNKNKKNRHQLDNLSDDYMENMAMSIKQALLEENFRDNKNVDEFDNRRRRRKRKKYENKEDEKKSKKKKKQEYSDELDESEMMCVRGASPVVRNSVSDQEDEDDSYASESSNDSRDNRTKFRSHRSKPKNRERKNNKSDRRKGIHPMQDPNGVCIYFMQGKCHKGDDCMFSHNAEPPRKLELCKFYLMECCAKRDKCLYMHSDFPCKYYHTGLPCIYKDECKFAHGRPLSDNLKNVLLKHLESAPKEILGDFPRLNREGAMKMIQTTQNKLTQQYCGDSTEKTEKAIPSLFDLNIPKPLKMHNQSESPLLGQSNDKPNKNNVKTRHSRWQGEDDIHSINNPNNNVPNNNILSVKNLHGVLSPRQISDLSKMGIETLDQLSQLTVLQINSIGISLKQISEIQMNTINIQNLGLINTSEVTQFPQSSPSASVAKDLDLRVAPTSSMANNSSELNDLPVQDVDMRFQQSSIAISDKNSVPISKKDEIDIDQYTKDALKFVTKDKDIVKTSKESDDVHQDDIIKPIESKDIDHRVLHIPEATNTLETKHSNTLNKESDTDIRFLQPDPIFKSPVKRNRRSTTDDEDNNLLIDEKWYSSDDEKTGKKSPVSSPKIMSPPQLPAPHVIESASVLSKLGDLSKIDISHEVTKLLKSMKDNLQEPSTPSDNSDNSSAKSRDPRSRKSPPPKSPKSEFHSNKPADNKPKISIYDCVEGEPTDGRRRSDVDLRDYKIPDFGDTDLRKSTSGDVDLRLPFKALPNYTPASEIDGSINSHPPIPFKLIPIDIPRPDYTDIKNSTARSQALVDPRLRKVFRLSSDEIAIDNENVLKSSVAPRIDPRRKNKGNDSPTQESKPTLDLQVIIQSSEWYLNLSSTQKIFVNQQIATISSLIRQYHQDQSNGKNGDLSVVHTNTVFTSIFTNLGIGLGDNGEFYHLPKPKEPLLKTPNINNYIPNNLPLGIENNVPSMMNNMQSMPMGRMPTMNNMAMPNIFSNNTYPDPRAGPAPGLLGIAPNMPHNFNNGNYHGPPNHYQNMPFNANLDYGNSNDEPSFHPFPNRGGHRGRGERWNRGGNRGRNNYIDNRKGDRN